MCLLSGRDEWWFLWTSADLGANRIKGKGWHGDFDIEIHSWCHRIYLKKAKLTTFLWFRAICDWKTASDTFKHEMSQMTVYRLLKHCDHFDLFPLENQFFLGIKPTPAWLSIVDNWYVSFFPHLHCFPAFTPSVLLKKLAVCYSSSFTAPIFLCVSF